MKKHLKKCSAILLAMLVIASAMASTVMAQEDASDTGVAEKNGNWYYYKNNQIDTTRKE